MDVQFIFNGNRVRIVDPPATLTILDYLREVARKVGTKEGCGQGDCGACCVAIASLDENRQLRYQTVNSCIRFVSALQGCALITVDSLGGKHPAQLALVDSFGSQCGFCTPGFVMSLVVTYENSSGSSGSLSKASSRDEVLEAISGNLCRCTGYRPIIDAGLRMHEFEAPTEQWWQAGALKKLLHDLLNDCPPRLTLQQALAVRGAQPNAQIIAGGTDVGIWVTKQFQNFGEVIDLTQVPDLNRVEHAEDGRLFIGAAVSLYDAFNALAKHSLQPNAINAFANRFAGKPIRTTGTMGGNVANGSPIGDSMPLLLAMGASVRLQSMAASRDLPLHEFYLGYKKTALAADELLTHILVPVQPQYSFLYAYKVSKRFEDDISAVCMAIQLCIADSIITQARIGVGGMAATPMRAYAAEAALQGQPLQRATFEKAQQAIMAEFSPLSDMRASAQYRKEVLGNLILRCWAENDSNNTSLTTLMALKSTQSNE